jgi:hypothetical protein
VRLSYVVLGGARADFDGIVLKSVIEGGGALQCTLQFMMH